MRGVGQRDLSYRKIEGGRPTSGHFSKDTRSRAGGEVRRRTVGTGTVNPMWST